MKFFIDTADIDDIKDLAATGLVDGVTTNPSLIAKSGGKFLDVIKQICEVVPGPVSAEVTATDHKTMLQEGQKLAKIAKNVCVKVPLTVDGLKTCKALSDNGTKVNVTLCFSAAQALLAAKAGATFISPFVGRLDDIGSDGMELIADIVQIYSQYAALETEVLVASVRHPIHIIESAKMGAHVATLPPAVLRQLFHHPLTDKGLAAFLADWAKTGQSICNGDALMAKRSGTTMADQAPERSKTGTTSATAAQVVAYLRRNPDFLARHPELLDLQLSPGRHTESGKGVVDLQQFMVERLRGEINKLRNDQDEILANTRDNLSTQERIHKAVVELLEAESFEQFIDIITGDLGLLLEVDVVSLCVELSDHTAKRPKHEGIQFLGRGAVDRALGGKDRHVVLRDEAVGDPEIFGAGAELVRSDAMLRLNISSHAPAGLIAFGARHPGYFHTGQGTELMAFLGRVIEFGIRTWLDLPKP